MFSGRLYYKKEISHDERIKASGKFLDNIDHITGASNFVAYLHNEIDSDVLNIQSRENNLFFFGLNLTRFAPVNDYLYHSLGDELLRKIRESISEKLREFAEGAQVRIYRYGGVNFVFKINNIAESRAGFILQEIEKYLSAEKMQFDLDIGQINNPAHRREVIDWLEGKTADQPGVKKYTGKTEPQEFAVKINGRSEKIISQFYQGVSINEMPLRSKKQHDQFVYGVGQNFGYIQIPGGAKYGRKNIRQAVDKLIAGLNQNTGQEQKMIYQTGQYYGFEDISYVLKKAEVAHYRDYDFNALFYLNDYSNEAMQDYGAFKQETKALLEEVIGHKVKNYEIIHGSRIDHEILLMDDDLSDYKVNKLYRTKSGCYLQPLYNLTGKMIACLKFKTEQIAEQDKYFNLIKNIESFYNNFIYLNSRDNLTGLPLVKQYEQDLLAKLKKISAVKQKYYNCALAAIDLDYFGAFNTMFDYTACNQVKIGVAQKMKELEKKYRQYHLKFYLVGGEEFKALADCPALELAQIMDELVLEINTLRVNYPIGLTKILQNLLQNYSEVDPELIKTARTAAIKNFMKKYSLKYGLELVQMPRLHNKHKKVVSGLTGSAGVLDLNNYSAVKKIVNRISTEPRKIAAYVSSLANFVQERTKEEQSSSQVMKIID